MTDGAASSQPLAVERSDAASESSALGISKPPSPAIDRLGGPAPQIVIVLIWSVVGLLNITISALGSHHHAISDVAATTACGILVSVILSIVSMRLIERRSPAAWLFLGGAISLGATLLWIFDTFRQIRIMPSFDPQARELLAPLLYNWVFFGALFSLQTAALALLQRNRALAMRERQLAAATLATTQAQLEALHFQLNPHFLFNTLNAVSILASEAGASEAKLMIERLSDFLRATLNSDTGELIALDREMETIEAYLGIEEARLEDRLAVIYDFDPDLGELLVPSLILQPLVENVLKHAVAKSKETVTMTITGRQRGGLLSIEVWNDGPTVEEIASPGRSVGLDNIRRRLNVIYCGTATLITQRTRHGFSALMELPVRATAPKP